MFGPQGSPPRSEMGQGNMGQGDMGQGGMSRNFEQNQSNDMTGNRE